jgi:hypothetical protein
MKKSENTILVLAFLCILLLLGIFQWGDYLIRNNYIMEPFEQSIYTNHNVDLPINTTFSCKNKCGPTARCSLTGQQCMADIDCPGCQPSSSLSSKVNYVVRGQNDAGKMTSLQYPTYSTLTTDIGTQAKFFKANNKYKGSPQANFGINTWRSKFDEIEKNFNKRYKESSLPYMKKYPYRYSITGEFKNNGPLPSNAYL